MGLAEVKPEKFLLARSSTGSFGSGILKVTGSPLKNSQAMRQTDQFTFFFSKYDVFSNWHTSYFTYRDVSFNCVEQMMMYAKAIEFGDKETAAKILQAPEPQDQKRLGRLVTPYDDERWKKIARTVVYHAAKAKFTQNPRMLERLLATEGTHLVEASGTDRLWGVGLKESDPRIDDPKNWRGSNWLGQTLTRLRDDLLLEQAPSVQKRPSP